MPRTPRWTDEELAEAVAASHSLREVSQRLGLRPGGGTYESLRRHIRRLGIPSTHLPHAVAGRPAPRRSWTDADLRAAVEESDSLAAVLRRLGYAPSGGMHRYMSMQIRRLGLTTTHFRGQGWARGRKRPGTGFRRTPLAEVLVANSTYVSSARLRRRLVEEGLKAARCELCGLDEWRGELLPLALDHMNGDHCDNRLENLRILCPNCHALTETWCGRNGRAGVLQRQRDHA